MLLGMLCENYILILITKSQSSVENEPEHCLFDIMDGILVAQHLWDKASAFDAVFLFIYSMSTKQTALCENQGAQVIPCAETDFSDFYRKIVIDLASHWSNGVSV